MNPRTVIPAVGRAAWHLPAGLRNGRPGILAARLTGAGILADITLHSGAGPPRPPAPLAGIVTWLVFTARRDLAPPPGR